MGFLLRAIAACHEDDECGEHPDHDHEEHESFIVHIIGLKVRLNLHLVRHIHVMLLRNAIAELLEPSCVIEDDQDLIMDLILGQEDTILTLPFLDLFKYDAFLAHEVALYHF